MALVEIREYADVSPVIRGQIPQEPGLADQIITTSGTSAASAAFNANTRMIAVSSPAAQAVAYLVSATPGATPTALTTSLRLPANNLIYLGVRPGDKIAFIDVT